VIICLIHPRTCDLFSIYIPSLIISICRYQIPHRVTFRLVREKYLLKGRGHVGLKMDIPTYKIEAIMTPYYKKEVCKVIRLYFNNRRGCMASFTASTILQQ
jgi:hypothetical protein